MVIANKDGSLLSNFLMDSCFPKNTLVTRTDQKESEKIRQWSKTLQTGVMASFLAKNTSSFGPPKRAWHITSPKRSGNNTKTIGWRFVCLTKQFSPTCRRVKGQLEMFQSCFFCGETYKYDASCLKKLTRFHGSSILVLEFLSNSSWYQCSHKFESSAAPKV